MQKHYLTNEIRFKINQAQVFKDFIVVRFDDEKWLLREDESPLDELKHRLDRVLSVAYLRGKQFYALFDKNEGRDEFALSQQIQPILAEIDPGKRIMNSSVYRIGKSTDKNSIDERHLLQLLINALPNLVRNADDEATFQNLSGRLLFVVNAVTRKSENFVRQYETLRFKVEYVDFPRLCLDWGVQTFTNITKQKATSAWNKKPGETPLYLMDDATRTMRRIGWAERDKQNESLLFLPVQFQNKKAVVPMIDFSGQAAFEKSKCGILYRLLQQSEKYLAPWFSEKIQLVQPNFDSDRYKYKNFDTDHSIEVQAHLHNFYNERTLVIVDEVESETSRILAERSRELLQKMEMLKNTKIEFSNSLSLVQPNLRIVESKESYERTGRPDPYSQVPSGALVHHLVTKEDEISEQALENILKETCLKHDVLQNQISLYNWQQHGAWHFMTCEGESRKNRNFTLLTILPGGTMQFEHCPKDAPEGSAVLRRLCTIFPTDEKEIEGLVISPEGDVNVISKTKQIVVPDLKHIGAELSRVADEYYFPKAEIIGFLNQFLADNPKFKKDKKVQHFAEKIRGTSEQISKTSLRGWLVGNEPGTNNRKMGDAFKKQFIALIDDRTGQLVEAFLRGEENKSLFPLNINFHGDSSEAFYYVGRSHGRGKSLHEKMVTASNIRKVKPLPGSKMVFDRLLDTLNVDFVKQKDLTVLPFPFKYLREYWNGVKQRSHSIISCSSPQ